MEPIKEKVARTIEVGSNKGANPKAFQTMRQGKPEKEKKQANQCKPSFTPYFVITSLNLLIVARVESSQEGKG